MLKRVKRATLSLTRNTGLGSLIARTEWRRRRLLVIGWHGVSRTDEHVWDPELYVSPRTLARRIASLRRCGCTVLPLDEAVAALRENRLPERAVTLTFDDGYVDFATVAWPMLTAARLPATVYLTTQRCERNVPVVRLLLRYVLWQHRRATLDGTGLPGLDARAYRLESDDVRREVVHRLGRMMDPRMPSVEKDGLVRRVADRIGCDYDALVRARLLTIMNPDEVRQVAGAGADVQLHTHCHYLPTDAADLADDLRRNQRIVHELSGRRARHFCYPSGEHRPWQLAVLRAANVTSAVTCDPGLAMPDGEPLQMPRLIDSDAITDVEFESWLTGTAMLLPRRRRVRAAHGPGGAQAGARP